MLGIDHLTERDVALDHRPRNQCHERQARCVSAATRRSSERLQRRTGGAQLRLRCREIRFRLLHFATRHDAIGERALPLERRAGEGHVCFRRVVFGARAAEAGALCFGEHLSGAHVLIRRSEQTNDACRHRRADFGIPGLIGLDFADYAHAFAAGPLLDFRRRQPQIAQHRLFDFEDVRRPLGVRLFGLPLFFVVVAFGFGLFAPEREGGDARYEKRRDDQFSPVHFQTPARARSSTSARRVSMS